MELPRPRLKHRAEFLAFEAVERLVATVPELLALNTISGLAASLARDPDVEPSTIGRPLALYHNLLVRADSEDPELARLAEALRRRGGVVWVPLAVLAVFLLYTSIAGGGTPSLRPSELAGQKGTVSLVGRVVGKPTGDDILAVRLASSKPPIQLRP